jgi:hypothetical protein
MGWSLGFELQQSHRLPDLVQSCKCTSYPFLGCFGMPDLFLVLAYGSQLTLGIRAGAQSCRSVAWHTARVERIVSRTGTVSHDAVFLASPFISKAACANNNARIAVSQDSVT